MNKYEQFDNYLMFDKISVDSIGVNFRAGELEENKVTGHKLLTDVYPFLLKNPEVWNRINIIL